MVRKTLRCVSLLLALCAHAQQEILIAYANEELPLFAIGNGPKKPDPPALLINRVAPELGITVKFQREPTQGGQSMRALQRNFEPDSARSGMT